MISAYVCGGARVAIVLAGLASGAGSAAYAADLIIPATDQLRAACLDGLIRPLDYVPGKNSFIVQQPAKGEKLTLLELQGSGSVRHIWSTWSAKSKEENGRSTGQILLRVYLNDEAKPSIEGTLDALFHAAEAVQTEEAPLPAFIYNRSFNLYLPMYFESGIRIEAEPTLDLREFYTQIDYRLTAKPESGQRLVSRRAAVDVELVYAGNKAKSASRWSERPAVVAREMTVPVGEQGLVLPGPAIVRRMTFQGEGLDQLELLIFWDDEKTPSVQAPLKYFFGEFKSATVESAPGKLTTWFPMPFRQQARVVLRGGTAREVQVTYDVEARAKLPSDVCYFHALYREMASTVGYAPYTALATRGAGHFVGIHLFDTGHDHGGGDTALIDAGTERPRVLHGVCGEDYFGFAWFDTGPMTPFVGAPVHERRYRLHLENPYPFSESLQFAFGTFAGVNPKSVAFWYQASRQPPSDAWPVVDASWNVLGPLAIDTILPRQPDDQMYKTQVPLGTPVSFEAKWEQVQMGLGFLDVTHHFRHYTQTKRGTGFVAGRSVTRLVTYVHSAEKRTLEVRLGHDDAATVHVNGRMVANLQEGDGFRGSPAMLPLEKGWNELAVTLENGENVNWRWYGLSLAVQDPAAVRFAAKPE